MQRVGRGNHGHVQLLLLQHPPIVGIRHGTDLGRDLKAFGVIRALLVEKLVDGGAAEFALGELLEQGLVVAAQLAGCRQFDFRPDGARRLEIFVSAGRRGFDLGNRGFCSAGVVVFLRSLGET